MASESRPIVRSKGLLTRQRGFVVGLLVSVSLLFIEAVSIKPWPIFEDASAYYAMAKDPFVFMGVQGNPFAYRILTPWLVHVLPLATDGGFRLVTTTSILLTALTLYVFLTGPLGFSPRMGILGQVLLITDICVAYNIANYRLVDPLAYFLLILGLQFAWTQENVLFAGSMALGVLNHEMQFILTPVYYFINKSKGLDLKCLMKTTLLTCPALVCFLLLHFLISGRIEEPSLNPAGVVSSYVLASWMTNPVRSIGLFIFSWSFLWATAILGYLRCYNCAKVKGLVSLVLLALLLAIPFDTSRMLAYAFPPIIAYSLYTLSSWSVSRRGLVALMLVVALQVLLQVALIVFVLPR